MKQISLSMPGYSDESKKNLAQMYTRFALANLSATVRLTWAPGPTPGLSGTGDKPGGGVPRANTACAPPTRLRPCNAPGALASAKIWNSVEMVPVHEHSPDSNGVRPAAGSNHAAAFDARAN